MYFLLVSFALGLGTFVQTIAGFGSALVAMPLITQFLGVRTAAPVQAIVGFFATATILYQNRHGFRWRESSFLIVGGILGIPLGALALRTLPSEPIVACLGAMMLAYAAFAYWIQPRLRPSAEPENGKRSMPRMLAIIIGFTSGVLGGAYATDGPPLIVYGSVKRWPKETFKSILQACFLVNGAVVIGCHGAAGLITRDVLAYCCFGVPGLLGGVLLGSFLDRRIDHNRFRKLLLLLIVILGVILLAGAIHSAAATSHGAS